MNYIPRKISPAIERGARYFPVVVITGPRQSGKSTLCKHLFADYAQYNLEDLGLAENIGHDPKGFLSRCGDKVLIDEIQHVPELFSYIQLAVDENPDRRFVLTGSSNFALMEKITQSLAGRAALFTLLPMALNELPQSYIDSPTSQLLYNGFYPSVVTDYRPADMFYPNYYSTYVERDLHSLKTISNLSQFQTFIRLVAARVGTEFNASQISVETGVTAPTIRAWMSILQASYIAFLLPPYYAKINKRLTKTPKIYFYDTGLLTYLLGIEEPSQLNTHPLKGGVFENLAIIELYKQRLNEGKLPNICYYRENSGRETDIMQVFGETLNIYEVKASQTWNKSFIRNIIYLKELFGTKIKESAVIYDGETLPPNTINIRQLTKYF
ncbi:MAG: AAA family ATPase [Muribaculaceae bacterium]|nr:AAA family ATPase [Muribaculaceae bacterium]